MNKIMNHLKKYISAGMIVVIPIFLVYLVLRFVYFFIDQNVMDFVENLIGIRIPGLGLFITIVVLYFIGFHSRNLLGKWVINIFEDLVNRIPIIGTTYKVGKQISDTLSLPEKEVFKKVVLVSFFKEDMYTVGFVTGTLIEKSTKIKYYKVYVPTPPNPTSGTILVVQEKDLIDPGWTIDEGMKTVISAGIIGPQDVKIKTAEG